MCGRAPIPGPQYPSAKPLSAANKKAAHIKAARNDIGSSLPDKIPVRGGLQCPRHLWLSVHQPLDFEQPEPGSTLDFGRVIGEKAGLLFPQGVLVTEPAWEHAKAEARTAALMADASVPAILEAAFTCQNVCIRVDFLTCLPTGWNMITVKSSTQVKDHYLDDMAVQAFVLAGKDWHQETEDRSLVTILRLIYASVPSRTAMRELVAQNVKPVEHETEHAGC